MFARCRDLVIRPGWRGTGLLLLCLALLGLYTAHNRFPYFYHTDEPGKVAQLVKGERNFHHPQLMLLATEAAARLLGMEWTEQSLVQVGRWYSAVCSTLAVAGLVLLTARLGSWGAAFLAGIAAGLHPLLFELSHYMKEDCGLLFGVVWTLLALDWFVAKPTLARAAVAGGMAGVAVSAKYVGIFAAAAALIAIVVVMLRREGGRSAAIRGGVFVLAAIAAFALINLEALLAPAEAKTGLSGEFRQMDRMAAKHSLIQTNYLAKIPRKIAPPLLIGAAGYLAFVVFGRRRRTATEWALVGFTFAYLASIHFTPLAKDRYLLPVLMMMCVMAALGARELSIMARRRRWSREWVNRGTAAAFVAVLAWQIPALAGYAVEFSHDSRREMVEWVRRNLPPEAVIAYDSVVGFSRSGGVLDIPQRTIRPGRLVSDLGGLEKWREMGITHVIVARHAWGNVFKRNDRPGSKYWPHRQVYESLFHEGELLWESDPGELLYLHPGIRIYAIGTSAPPVNAGPPPAAPAGDAASG